MHPRLPADGICGVVADTPGMDAGFHPVLCPTTVLFSSGAVGPN